MSKDTKSTVIGIAAIVAVVAAALVTDRITAPSYPNFPCTAGVPEPLTAHDHFRERWRGNFLPNGFHLLLDNERLGNVTSERITDACGNTLATQKPRSIHGGTERTVTGPDGQIIGFWQELKAGGWWFGGSRYRYRLVDANKRLVAESQAIELGKERHDQLVFTQQDPVTGTDRTVAVITIDDRGDKLTVAVLDPSVRPEPLLFVVPSQYSGLAPD